MRRGRDAQDQEAVLLGRLVDDATAAVYVYDGEDRFTYVNRRFEEIFGRERAAFLGRHPGELFPPDVAAALVANNARARVAGPQSFLEHVPHADGMLRAYATEKFPLDEGMVAGVSVERPAPGGGPAVPAAPGVAASEQGGSGIAPGVAASEMAVAQVAGAVDLGLLLAGLADGLSVHDAEGRYLFVSPSFAALSGHEAQDLLGASPFELDLFHPEDVERVVAAQTAALEDGEPFRVLYRLRRSDDAFVWVESTGRTVPAADGPRFVLVTRDASHLVSLVRDTTHERRAALQLEELVARQRHFLTTVSHRARTPLTAVVGMGRLLQQGAAEDPERRELLLDRLVENADRLARLLSEVTDADRLSRSDVMLERRVVDLRPLVEEVVSASASEPSRVEVDVPADLRAVVDREKVSRILSVLLDNAFTHGGVGVAVTVRARATTGGVELVVEDDGPGVPPSAREAVFDAFVQGDRDRADPGAGLGLHIVSELAGLHRGRVWVDERPGGGARFHVALPDPSQSALVAAATDEASPAGAPESRAGPLSPEAERFVTRLLDTLRGRVEMDVAYLTLLDDTEQQVLSVSGGSVAGIAPGLRVPLEDTYCARMLAGDLPPVVGETAADPAVADLPATRAGLAGYVGVPVHLPSGQVVGTLCCASGTPRPGLPQAMAEELRAFATILGDQFAAHGVLDATLLDTADRVVAALAGPGGFHPVFQPVVALADRATAGFEALSRFPGSSRPVELWFADAARAGLLVELEVEAAARALARLEDLPAGAHLSVNVSSQTARSPQLDELLAGLPRERVVLELAEHAVRGSDQPLRDALEHHRQAGLRVAVDHVATGRSSLGHLAGLDPDVIKLDRSLVAAMERDRDSVAAVTALAGLAEHLGAALVAVGVEREDTLQALRQAGCSHAQGHLLGRPTDDPRAAGSRRGGRTD